MAFVRMMAVQGRRCIIALSLLLVVGAAEAASSAMALSHERSVVVVARGSGPALCGLWGDVNDDGQVGSVDALITLQSAVGLPVPDPARVALAGDVNNDGQVNSADALAILQYVVGLGAGTTRVGQQICAVASVTVTPGSATIAVGATAQLTATLRDAQGNVLTGRTVTWSGSDATKASVSPTGLVTGVAAGSATITALSEGVSGAAAITVSGSPPPPPGGQGNVIVDPSRTFQTINGWMGALAGGWTYTPALRDAIVDALIDDLGVTRVRLDTTGAIEGNGQPGVASGIAVNDNADPNNADLSKFTWTLWDPKVTDWVLPIKQKVEARGEPFVLQVTYNGHAASTAFQKNPAEYAEFVSVVLNRLRSRWGIEPDVWDIANEPDNSVTKNGTELGQMMKAAGDRARSEGFHKVMFMGPSVTDANNAVSRLSDMLAVPGAAQYLAEASFHRYRSGATESNLNAIRAFAQARGLRTHQNEFIGADYKMLYTDLTEANVSAWTQYTMACCNGAGTGTDVGGTFYRVVAGSFSEAMRTPYLKQYFKYIRPGAVRLEVTSTDAAIQPVAFRNPNGNMVVVAYTTGAATLKVAGLAAGTYQVTFTTSAQRGASAAPVTIGAGQTLTTAIPAAGVITVWR